MLASRCRRTLARVLQRPLSQSLSTSTTTGSSGAHEHFTRSQLRPLVLGATAGVLTGSAMLLVSCETVDDDGTETLLNWSATHACRPQRIHEPQTLDELRAILQSYHKSGRKLRCMGNGISPNGLGFSTPIEKTRRNEDLVTLSAFDRILDIDQDRKQVTVESGVNCADLLQELRQHNLTLCNVASIREQQIGGLIQAGCHGTGARIAPLDDHVVEMQVETPNKGALTLSKESNAELFELAKCGLGALGVVTKLTIQCEDVHRLVEYTSVCTIDEVREKHVKWLGENQHLRYMWLPYTDAVVVVRCKRLSDDVDVLNVHKVYPPPTYSIDEQLQPIREFYLEMYKDNIDPDYTKWGFTKLREKLLEVAPLDLEYVKRVNGIEKQFWNRNEGYRVGLSDDIIGFDCGFQQLVQEVAFPCSGTLDIDFTERLLDRISKRAVPAHCPIEQRWSARSSSAMSPAHSKHPNQLFSWVGVILYLPTEEESLRKDIISQFNSFYGLYQDHMEPFGGMEHWAKIEWPKEAAEKEKMRSRLQKRYSLEAFGQAREQVDPKHILSNHIVDELLA